MDALCLFTNEKRQAPEHDVEFIGLAYDTATCTFVLTKTKVESLQVATAAATLASTLESSPRTLAKFRGKLSWYSPCVSCVRLLTLHITAAIGAPDSHKAWDKAKTLLQDAHNELQW